MTMKEGWGFNSVVDSKYAPGHRIKLPIRYDIDPDKIIERCHEDPVFKTFNPNDKPYLMYHGIEEGYHVFLTHTERMIGVLAEQINHHLREKNLATLIQETLLGE